MDIIINGELPSQSGPEEWFTGDVRVSSQFSAEPPARVSGATVTFQPGARTAWHSHPLGQTLFVTQGIGWVQKEGGPRLTMRPGDVVEIAPDERHWHGATDTNSVTHIAIAEVREGSVVDWMEHVSDEDYVGVTSAD